MKSNLEYAIDLLRSGDYTLVLKNDIELITSKEKGISPLIGLIESGRSLESFSCADKIVGKAAALLYAKLNVKELYAEVLSKAAQPVLKKHNISYSFGTLTASIINRKGDGICPMEQTVTEINNCDKAYSALKNKLSVLKNL